ncbi:restriction endonuclease subunit S [Streptomyces hainanensis]|uniref:Restriction endonuclease subunit S n=1 Tax=Streptomyces hainanensis TaxID=402648 RepID=A0A4R4TIB6_9ACTN|nr:restriction endonuclease subunit S [Streptomyces hainanensis]TDC76126.1 restriction endonuclease subunit S [Streptomyces hainanensis]
MKRAVVPSGWKAFTLGELFEFSNGVNADKSAYGEGIPFINVLDVIENEALTEADIRGRIKLASSLVARYQVRYGDVLLNRTSETQDEVALAAVYLGHSPVVFGGFVFRARPKTNNLDTDYLKYALRTHSVREQIVARGQGGIRANVGQRDLRTVHISLPSVDEQRTIAVALSGVDQLVAALELMIAKKQATKQGMLQHLLTGEFRLSGWPGCSLSELIDGLEAGVSVRSSKHTSSGVAVLKTSAVDNGRFIPSEAKPVLSSDVGRVHCNPVADSLIISRMNTPALVGEVGYVEHDYSNLYLPDRLWLARAKRSGDRQVNMRWLGYYLSSGPGSRAVRGLATGTSGSMKNIPKERLLAIEVPTPPPDEQDRIAEAMLDVEREINLLRDRLSKARGIKQGMMQQLLTGRTRLPVEEGSA